MKMVSDLSLLVKKAKEDPGAFAQLYAHTFSFSYSVARRYLNNQQDIEDVLQTSYMYAASSLSDLRDPDNFQSWMRTILIHECQKCLRTNKKYSDLLVRSKDVALHEDEQGEWTDILEQNERYETVRNIVNSLPNEQKMCAALFYFEGKSITEISELLNVPQGTVKSRLYHVRKKFEKEIKRLSKKDNAFFGVAPVTVLRSYFKHGERELAEASVREEIWAAILSKGTVSRGAGHILSLGAATSGLSGAAVSSGVTAATVIKAAAITVSAVAVVGGGLSVRDHVKTTPVQPEEVTTAAAETTHGENNNIPITEVNYIPTEITTLPAQPATTRPESETTQANNAAKSPPPVATTSKNPVTTRPPSTTARQNEPTAARQTTVPATTAAPLTTVPNPVTTQPNVDNTTAPTVSQTTAYTERTTVQPSTTQAVTDTADYQMSGGVLRGYTGSESALSVPSTVKGETVTAIGSGAFAQNKDLRSVSLPDTVTQIGQEAFSDCTSLQSVSLPSSLISIGAGAFDGCTSLASVNVPGGTESIGDDAFSGCASLSMITIPPSVNSIGDYAFDGCEGLTIQCEKNSAAHLYAEENEITYQLVEGL